MKVLGSGAPPIAKLRPAAAVPVQSKAVSSTIPLVSLAQGLPPAPSTICDAMKGVAKGTIGKSKSPDTGGVRKYIEGAIFVPVSCTKPSKPFSTCNVIRPVSSDVAVLPTGLSHVESSFRQSWALMSGSTFVESTASVRCIVNLLPAEVGSGSAAQAQRGFCGLSGSVGSPGAPPDAPDPPDPPEPPWHTPALQTEPTKSAPRFVQSASVDHCGRFASTMTLQPASHETSAQAVKIGSPRAKRPDCGTGSM